MALPADHPTIMKTIGQKIAEIRRENKLSQRELAILTNRCRQHISNIERGFKEPRLPMLRKIAAALNVPLRELLPEE